jgi:predicted DNA-binding transcriptional regulator AlpA
MSNAAIKLQAITEHHAISVRSTGTEVPDPQELETRNQLHILQSPGGGNDRLLNARQVAEKLGVSERFIRDHTTRRSPRIPAVKLGKLLRYRTSDVDVFMAELGTQPSSRRSRFGV